MELFKQTNIDFLKWRMPALGLSLALILAAVASLAIKGPNYGIDFRGGTLVYVNFASQPPVPEIRQVMQQRVGGDVSVTTLGDASGGHGNEVVIGTELRDEKSLDVARQAITRALAERFGNTGSKLDLNNASRADLLNRLRGPLMAAGVGNEEQLQRVIDAIRDYRDRARSGLVTNLDELRNVAGVTPAVLNVLKQELGTGQFAIRQVEIVGPKAGRDLQQKAILATLYALGGMLIYIAIRFEFIAGVAAVVAIIHDVFITLGFFSWFDREISLTVLAALLTLIGY
jgi:preprotein translocase subunit SecF